MVLYRNKDWDAFRDAVIHNDGYKCVRCGRCHEETTLQVHHKTYLPNAKPWEYGMEMCETLCKRCHAEEHGEIMPQTGWELVGMTDLGDLIGECERCHSNLRYEFEIVHEKWGSMIVGTQCCDRLTSSEWAQQEVDMLEKRNARKKRFLKSKRWNETDNVYRIQHGIFPAEIRQVSDGWILVIDGKSSKNKRYPTLNDAKEKLFDVVENGELVEWYKRNGCPLPTTKKLKNK